MALAIALGDSKNSQRTLKTLAKSLQTALGLSGYLPAVISAGERMMIYNDINREYVSALDAAVEDRNNDQLERQIYTLEIALQLTTEEMACRECGPRLTAMRRMLDYANAFGPRLRIYPVCRAKTTMDSSTKHSNYCGIALPTILWTQPEPSLWKFNCKVNWSAFITALKNFPEDPPCRNGQRTCVILWPYSKLA